MDTHKVAQELLRAIRGSMSQVAFSRLLGYRSNTAADWESGRRFPTVHEALRAAERRRLDPRAALSAFAPRVSAPPEPDALAPWLDQLRGSTSNRRLAERTGLSEHRIGRWLLGVSEPRLPEFLQLVEAITSRCSDLVAALVPIESVPSLRPVHEARTRVRRLVFERPWTAAILTQLGVLQPHPAPGPPIARSLGLPLEQVEEILALLQEAGVLAASAQGLRVVAPLTVDARPTREELRGVREHWSQVSHERLCAAQPEDRFTYNVFNVSQQDLVRIVEIQAAAHRQIREIVAASQPPEVTALLVTHLFGWPLRS
jgi:transcriptional regulator with XRE-family HTH domain